MKTNFQSKLILALFLSVFQLMGVSQLSAQNPFGHKDSTRESGRNIFGTDDRKAAVGWSYRDYTKATGVAVFSSQFQGNYLTGKTLAQQLLEDWSSSGAKSVSADIRFRDEPAFGFCSGFLIAPDMLVTAGHCLDYDDYFLVDWIFDYTNDIKYKPGDRIYIAPENRYKTKSIMTHRFTDSDLRDYCVIQLDRPVTGRIPFTFRTSQTVENGDKITLLGAPWGIPLKIVENSKVTSKNIGYPYFDTNLDAFGGNSGGPVFAQSGLIEGILVRGPSKGYYVDATTKELKQSTYSEAYAEIIKGVSVHKVNDIPWEILTEAIYRNLDYAITRNDASELKRWLAYNWVFEEETLASKTPLMIVAAKQNNIEAIKTMISAGAGVNVNDENGKSLLSYALSAGDNALFNLLIREGVDLNAVNSRGENAVFAAIAMFRADKLALVVKNGASVNVKNIYGSAPIHEVAYWGDVEMATILLEAGADIFATDDNGKTAFKIAKKQKNKELKKYLKKEAKKRK